MFALGLVTILLIIRSNRRFRAKADDDNDDATFRAILSATDKSRTWTILLPYITGLQQRFLLTARNSFSNVTEAFVKEDLRTLDKEERLLANQKKVLKNARRKETLCLRQVSHETAIEKSAWFHLANNCCMSMLYNLRRINEICKEHVENNFLPLPPEYRPEFESMRTRIEILFNDILEMTRQSAIETVPLLRRHCDEIKDTLSDATHRLHAHLHEEAQTKMTVIYVYLNMLQETREIVSSLRKYLRAYSKMHTTELPVAVPTGKATKA